MKVGIALNMLCQAGRSDAAVVGEHLALGDLAEPLGFDSLFTLEHHFTGYAMSPSPIQLLSYAGRTKRIMLGTAVIMLPWHDPARVAEEIALLDVRSGGRCLFGFGRDAASVDEAQERAVQYLSRKWNSIDHHYHCSDGRLATVKGYECYGKMAKTYSKMQDESYRQKATEKARATAAFHPIDTK